MAEFRTKASSETRHRMETNMARTLLTIVIGIAILVLFSLNGSALASENIYGLKIENINRNGADFYWSTSVETKGSIDYAYAKLRQLYNPQSPGRRQDILVTAVPVRTKSEPYYVKEHHIRVDDLDMYYAPIVQYTIKSETFHGDVYTLSGELVLVDTGATPWWQTMWFAVGMPLGMFVLGYVVRPIALRIKKAFQSRKAKRQ